MVTLLTALYVISVIGLALIGFNSMALSVLYLIRRRRAAPSPVPPRGGAWPSVVVQLPVYNERYVVERLIQAVTALDYPRDRLVIQVLDDSTDETTAIAAVQVERARQQGVNVKLVRRADRAGYKAGALAHGLEATDAEFVAVFDADFLPQPDFLKQVIPHFVADEQLGLVQARWAHLNAEESPLTRAQALALDAHFVVEQTARHRGGLLMNFSGTAGVWRRACIEGSGGWHTDTLSEDIDLSYRAQMGGWRCLYLPEVGVPAEVPPTIMAFKRQQARWATGTVQCLRKLGGQVLRSSLTFWQKVEAMLHLGGYFIHPLMIVLLLTSVPLMLAGRLNNLPLAGLGLAAFGHPIMTTLGQRYLYRDWARRLLGLPVLMLLGMGIAVSNTCAVGRAFTDKPLAFQRTPKYHATRRSVYALPVDLTTWIELALALYAAVATVLALSHTPALAPFMALYALGLGYVAGLSVWQVRGTWRRRERKPPAQAQGRVARLG